MKSARTSLSFVISLVFALVFPLTALAQSSEPSSAATTVTRIFPLKNITQIQEGIDLLNLLRNVSDPHDRFMISQNTIVIEAPPDHATSAEKIIQAFDKPKKAYRLIYTLIDFDGTKRLGDQHYSMVLVSSQRTILKQGNRVPIITGTDFKNPNNPQTQYTYLDIGMNFDATIDDAPNSLRLKAKIEQSSVVDNRSGALPQEPLIRQSLFEGSAVLTPGKPIILGSLDITGTTRRIEIQATLEPLTP